MPPPVNGATAVLSALRLARQHGGAESALRTAGIRLPELERFEGLADEVRDLLGGVAMSESLRTSLALGFLAGRLAHRPRARMGGEPTSFVMDPDLVVRGAEGGSILRLPWFDEGLFVGRQLPDISEMPDPVRSKCVAHYSAALAGERGRFDFLSYGHAYSVEAVPVHGEAGGIDAVLAVATPTHSAVSAAAAYERTAEGLDDTATRAERRADAHRLAGRGEAEAAERRAAQKARHAADRHRASGRRLRARGAVDGDGDAPTLTARETEVLQLASLGLATTVIADQLSVTVATVRTHLENSYPKLGANDKAAAVAIALRHGLID